ncbi:hypothetical protein FGIG_04079 [Fasciola gigantica]|uniref:Uncharacterized protein n=1 Tax=Fasciola gigantica TaxID=46835 RepID=A0A504YMB9_FASGI|nr:hypothetical protein FGIG_04079 [Fasciola gigantica]
MPIQSSVVTTFCILRCIVSFIKPKLVWRTHLNTDLPSFFHCFIISRPPTAPSPQIGTVHPIKHIDSTSHSSTSSGASSLQGTQSGAHSSSTDHTRPSISSGELTHMICLVAQQWASLLPECWSPNPDARLTAQRVRKVLQKLTDRLDLFRMSRNETPSVLRHHAMRSITTQPRSSSPTIQEARSK